MVTSSAARLHGRPRLPPLSVLEGLALFSRVRNAHQRWAFLTRLVAWETVTNNRHKANVRAAHIQQFAALKQGTKPVGGNCVGMIEQRLYDVLAAAFAAEGVDTHFTLLGDGNMHWATVLAERHGVRRSEEHTSEL